MRIWLKSNELIVKMLTIPNTEQLKLKDDIPARQGVCKHYDEAGSVCSPTTGQDSAPPRQLYPPPQLC